MPPGRAASRGDARRHIALLAMLALAVVLGAGLRAAGAQDDPCPRFDLADLRLSIERFDVIVLGEVVSRAGAPAIAPEVWLKGPASAETIVLEVQPASSGGCALPGLPAAGTRVIAALQRVAGGFAPPEASALFVIESGIATNGAAPPEALPEAALVARIRAVTGQFAVPAADSSGGASFDWLRVVLPVAGASLAILAVALALLRIWHRIDPT